ncbi:MAG: hypothetical protein HKP27_01500 [Myxococcales bacterium]|nr:hypothetical protein [Myxococcales bacterium]
MPKLLSGRLLGAVLAVLLCAPLSGCFMWNYGHFDPLARGDSFDESRKRFTRMIRWGQIERAGQYVVESERDAFFEAATVMRGVRFSDYEVLRVEVEDGFDTAIVEVMFRGYSLASSIERSVAVTQSWERGTEGSGWRVRPEIQVLSGAFID